MEEYEMEWIREVRENAGKLASHIDKDAMDRLLLIYTLESDNKEEIKQEIDSLIDTFSDELLLSNKPVLEYPSRIEAEGEIEIGRIMQGDKTLHSFGLNLNELTRHVGIYGQTGHGKTSLLYSIMDQLIELNIPFTYFDLKRDGRCLLRQHRNLIVIPWRELKWNPLRNPPGMSLKSYWQLYAEVCGHVWGIYHAGVNYILEYLDRMYEELKNGLPTLVDLYKLMVVTQETTRKRLEYFDVMYNRVRALVSILGSVIDVQTGIKLEELLNYPVVIELDQLRADEQNWIVEVMLTWIYAYRMVQGHRSEKLRHCVIIDEAHRIFDVNKEFRETTREMGMPTINLFPTQFRDFGESLMVTSQEPSKVTDSIHANTLVKIVGNLGSGKDVKAISEAMNLSDEEKARIPMLQRGEWLAKMSDRYTKPFLVATPYHPADKDVTDEEVRQRMQPFLLKVMDEVTKDRLELLKQGSTAPQLMEQETHEAIEPSLTLSEDGWALLLDINSHPFRGLTGRYKGLNLSGRKANSAKNELVQKGLVVEVSVALGSNRPVKFLTLTNMAITALESIGHDVRLWKHTVGHMGFKHQLYSVLIAYTFREAGYQTFIEKNMGNNRRVDVLVLLGGEKVAIEVETGVGIDIDNKLKVLDEVDELIIVVDERRDVPWVREAVGDFPPGRVQVYHVIDYLRYLKANYSKDTVGNRYKNSDKPDFRLNSGDKVGRKRK